MTQFNPFLKLNRLVILSEQGTIAYDESFHDGVNIIRGHNSSGKSTISNFIMYALGGHFTKWTTAALLCGDVFAEVQINSEPITLKRTVSTNRNQPMSIFWGNYLDGIKSVEGWQIFPYNRSESKKSFSNALFTSLGFPELRGDVDSNITMHQILRMLYLDQKSLTLDLLMTESFDSAITRKTISDLLFGVYDDSLYTDKISLRDSEKDFEVKRKQLDGIERIFRSSDTETNPNTIKALIDDGENEILSIDQYIELLEQDAISVIKEKEEKQLTIVGIKKELIDRRAELSLLQSKINDYEFELIDSEDFIISLENRAVALNDSLLTRGDFQELQMTLCPSCLSPLEPISSEDHCKLCKQQLPEDKGSSQIKRMQQEIDNQLRESKKLYSVKEHDLLELKASYPTIEMLVIRLENELNDELKNVQSSRNKELNSLLVRKGELKSRNGYFIQQLKALEQIDVIRQEITNLQIKIKTLKTSINSKEYNQKGKLETAYQLIESYTLRLLGSDLGRQKEFQKGTNIELNFEKNTFSLDGENNFSESSNVYLKNSVRFAIFFASLELDFFRYPRFIFCDNIEDKGMEPERSQSFQNEIVRISSELKIKHQIIITTSMISPGLEGTDLCIGEFYSEHNKTLKI